MEYYFNIPLYYNIGKYAPLYRLFKIYIWMDIPRGVIVKTLLYVWNIITLIHSNCYHKNSTYLRWATNVYYTLNLL
jgi:hypothetical protein